VDLTRLNSGAAFLVNHNPDDFVGAVDQAWIAKRKGHAVLEFSESDRAGEIWTDTSAGRRSNYSIGYKIKAYEQDGELDDKPIVRVTEWEPFEISTVPVPADPTIGLGRRTFTPITNQMEKEIKQQDAESASNEERRRCAEIAAIGQMFGSKTETASAISNGTSVDDFRRSITDKWVAPTAELDTSVAASWSRDGAPNIITERVENYSVCRAISGASEGKLDGLEAELSQEIARRTNRPAAGFYIPSSALGKRDLTSGSDAAGGYLKPSHNMQMIDRLSDRMLVAKLGARVLTGLTRSPQFPRMDTGSTAYWVAESGAPTESTPAFTQVAMSRKTISADTEFTKELIVEASEDVEHMVRDELVRVIALGIDNAAINGTGSSNQPTGILNTSGIGAVAAGTNGEAVTWADVVNLKREIRIDNGDTGTIAYLTNPQLEAKLMTTEKASSTGQFIFEPGDDEFGRIAGRPCGVSNAVPADGTKGSGTGLSTIMAGVFSELLIGYWGGGLDVVVDPFSKRTSRIIGITASNFCDIAVRHPQSFAALQDAVTT
jgi:HK97 family phage major capsid protein